MTEYTKRVIREYQDMDVQISGLWDIFNVEHPSKRIYELIQRGVYQYGKGSYVGFLKWLGDDPYAFYDYLETESP